LKMDNSFDENDSIDLASVVAELREGDDGNRNAPPKKNLSDVFDGCMANGGMKVYLRVRPIKSKEEGTITVESDTSIVTNAPESSKRAQYTKTEARHYIFSRVFGGTSAQDDIFNHAAAPLLRKFLNGENAVLFAYGMTNAGKTYTMQGTNNNPGIMPKLVTAIIDEMSNSTNEWDLHVSMLEIYQENIYDLLAKKKKDKLTIRDANGKVEVNRLSTHSIKSTKEACKLMDTAAYNRSKSSTFLNTGSSRSHAVYTITLDRSNEDGVYNQSVAFQLVDLAGAERGNRTKATAAQQKEANNINMSLMQLWRCLQGMKKRNTELGSSQEIIPFRESKLTHLLMPILNRAGMAGTAMIACVNPQIDDYDETISILSNASIASKITEISDVGRTAGQLQSSTAVAAVAAAANALAATAAATAAAAAADKKRRRIEAAQANAAAGNGAHRGMRDSTCSVVPAGAVAKAGRPISSKATAVVLSGSKRKADSDASMASLQTVASADTYDAEDSSELKRLRVEVVELRAANEQLVYSQLNRETEIRIEVSQEMAKRSHHLLEQIQSLQRQLAARDTAGTTDLTRSVKKERKRQMKTIAEECAGGMLEVEEELERVKATYDQEVALLRSQNKALSMALEKYQNMGGPAGIMPPSSKITSSSSSSSSLQQNLDSSSAQVAAEFNKRFSKKGNEENCVVVCAEKASPLKKSPLSKSPSRSPLSEVRNVGNSPVSLKSYQNGTVSATAKRVDSPQRLRENETNSGYGTRLRSQIRA